MLRRGHAGRCGCWLNPRRRGSRRPGDPADSLMKIAGDQLRSRDSVGPRIVLSGTLGEMAVSCVERISPSGSVRHSSSATEA
jgi:hypothetical protein